MADQKFKQRLIEFLRQIHYLKYQTRQQVARSIHGVKNHTHTRGQVVCKEGDIPRHVYIVGEGEYEVVRKVRYELHT